MGIAKIKEGVFRVRARLRLNGQIVQTQNTLTGSTREAAKAVLEKMKAEIRTRVLTGRSLTTFAEVLSIYREKRNKNLAPDVSRLDRLKADLGKVPLNVFADRFEAYMRLFKNTPMAKFRLVETKKKKLPSNASANRIVEMVRAAFNLAVQLGLLNENPITKARFPKAKESPRDRYLSNEERGRLLNAIEASAPYLFPFVRYSLLVPCRKSELVNLPKEAYNAFTNTIYVPKSKAGIPIHKPVPEEMKEYFQGIPAGCPWLFYRQDGEGGFQPLGDFRKAFKTCLKAAGLQNVRVHDLRHVAASDLCAFGNSERAIMDIAGWKTPMLSTYWHKDSLKSAQTIRFSANVQTGVQTLKASAV